MRQRGRQSAFSALIAALALMSTAQASAQVPSGASPEPLQATEIRISPEFGYILQVRQPATPASHAPILIHIQEAHANEQAQRAMIGILEELISRHGLRLILVEGGQGNVSLSYLRQMGTKDNRREVAEHHLKLGLISAEEYLDMVSDAPLTLWGIEREDLYRRHVQAFIDAEAVRERVAPTLTAARQAVEALSPILLDPDLNALNATSQAFASGTASLAGYATLLKDLAARHHVEMAEYPSVARFLQVSQLEQSIHDEATPQAERVSNYDAYQSLSAQLKPLELKDELERLVDALRKTLSSSPEAGRLQTIDGQLGLVEKLVALKLSPDEDAALNTIDLAEAVTQWAAFLPEQLGRAGLAVAGLEGLSTLPEAVEPLRKFYAMARERDEVLVQGALAKLKDTHAMLAALITGGFHGPQLGRRLSEQGVGVVSVVPNVSHPTNDHLYRAVLRYKSGHGLLADVELAAQAQGDVR